MDMAATRVLIIEESEDDYRIVRDLLGEIDSQLFDVEWVQSIEAARVALDSGAFDVCLVKHRLKGRSGLILIEERIVSDPPFIVLAGNEDHATDVAATKAGARDYLLKGHLNAPLLERSIRYAIEQARQSMKLEAALEQNDLLAAAVTNLTDGMVITDTGPNDYAIIFANAAFCALTGYALEEIVGRNCRFLQGEETDPQTLLQIREAIEAGRPFKGVLLNYRKDGTPFWNGLKLTPVFDGEGQLKSFVGLQSDVSERRQSEIALRESEARSQAVIHNALDCIITIDHHNRVVEFNPAAEATFGFTRAQALGQNLNDLIIPPAFQEAHGKGFAHYIATGEGPILGQRLEMPALRKDGSLITVELTVTVMAHSDPPQFIAYLRDISRRQQTEAALRQSEERFAGIVANVPGMVYQFALHPDGSVEWPFVSQGSRGISGLEPEEIQNDPLRPLNLILPEDRLSFDKSLAASAQTLSPWRWEGRHRLDSGRTAWIQGTSRPQRLPDGGTLWNGIVTDITALKEAEEERDRFFTMSLDMLGIFGLDGYFKRLNPAFSETLGYSEAELLAKPFVEFVHPEDRAATLETLETLSRNIPIRGFENRYLAKDGSYRWLEWKATVTVEEGIIYAVARNVTDRKAAQAALLRSHDDLEERVAARTEELNQTNLALQFQVAERQAAEAQTRARARQQEAVVELGQHALSDPDLSTLLQGALALSAAVLDVDFGVLVEWFPHEKEAEVQAALGRPSRSLHERIPVPPGSFIDYVLRSSAPIIMEDSDSETRFEISPLMRQQGLKSMVALTIQASNQLTGAPPYGALAVGSPRARAFSIDDLNFLQSISNILATTIEQRRIQQVAQLAREEAERANLAKSEFLSRMSHELRTPLNAILGFGQILDRQELSPLQRESIGYILKGGRHLLSLINEVLDIARVEAGHIELSIEPVPLGDVVAESCALVRPLADERGIQIVADLSGAAPVHAMADRQRLKQVLINLLSNAIKYNRQGGDVKISLRQIAGGRIQLRVEDSGLGMAPEDLKKLFTPFERLGAADSSIEGTGLGLVLSQRLATSMGATLGVESIVGQGSTFGIELLEAESPLETLAESPSILSPEELRGETSAPDARTYTVLSIEDNLSNIQLLEAVLESRPGVTLLTAMQGSIGLDLARRHHPDLILLDLHLPGLSGSEVLAQLRQAEGTREIPVIVISADATPAQIERLMSAGAIAYLTKPLDIEGFLNKLDEVLLMTPISTRLLNAHLPQGKIAQ